MHLYFPRTPPSARLVPALTQATSTYAIPPLRTSRLIATSIYITGPRPREYNRTAIASRYLHLTTLITPISQARGVHTLPSPALPEEPPKNTAVSVGQGDPKVLEGEEAMTKPKEAVQEGQAIETKPDGVQLQVTATRNKKSAPAQTTANVLPQESESATISPAPKKKKKQKKEAKNNDTQLQVTAPGGKESVLSQTTADVLARQPESKAVSVTPKKKKGKKAKQNDAPIETSASKKPASTLLPMVMGVQAPLCIAFPPFLLIFTLPGIYITTS